MPGMSGRNRVAGSSFSALAARAVGPPHGVRFMIPLVTISRQTR